jgi:hypothetical protein
MKLKKILENLKKLKKMGWRIIKKIE